MHRIAHVLYRRVCVEGSVVKVEEGGLSLVTPTGTPTLAPETTPLSMPMHHDSASKKLTLTGNSQVQKSRTVLGRYYEKLMFHITEFDLFHLWHK